MIPISVLQKMEMKEKAAENQYHQKLTALKDMIVKIESAVDDSQK